MANLEVVKGKIQWARVTQCELDYIGSISIDQNLLDVAGFVPMQFVDIWNQAGARIQTYILPAPAGSKTICVNGSAARHFVVGDKIIIAGRLMIEDPREMFEMENRVAIMGDENELLRVFRYEVFADESTGTGFNVRERDIHFSFDAEKRVRLGNLVHPNKQS